MSNVFIKSLFWSQGLQMRTDKGQVVRGTDQCYAIEQLFHVVGRNHKSVNKEEKVDSLGHEQ